MQSVWAFFCAFFVSCAPSIDYIGPVDPDNVTPETSTAAPVEPVETEVEVTTPEPTETPSEAPSKASVEVSEPEPTTPEPTTPEPEATATATAIPSETEKDAGVDMSVWDRVASCESNGDWSIKPSDHSANYNFYGGLQFSEQSWYGAGGDRYAPRADLATKAEQIAVARRLLAMQGPTAWPNCGPAAGLTKANGGATMEFVVG